MFVCLFLSKGKDIASWESLNACLEFIKNVSFICGIQEVSSVSLHTCVVTFTMIRPEHARCEKLVRRDVLWECPAHRI